MAINNTLKDIREERNLIQAELSFAIKEHSAPWANPEP